MSFVQFFRIVWARRAIWLTATLVCFVAAVVIAKMIPPRYEARSRVMLDIVKPDPVTGEVMASGFARAYVKTQIELIRDYRIAGKVVDSLGWTSNAALAQQYAQRNPSDSRDFRRWLAQRIMDNTDANLIEASNILEIRYVTSSADTAAKVADTIRQAYVDQMVAFRRDDAGRNADWFRQQAVRIRQELTTAEKRKSDFERANGILLQDNNMDVETTRLQALAATSPLQQQQAATPQMPIDVSTDAQLRAADAQIASVEKVLGPNNPELQNLKRQRDVMAQNAAAMSRSVVRPAPVAAGPTIGQLYSAQQAKVLAQRGKVSEAQQLAADIAVLRSQYVKATDRAGELQQQGESTETGLTLLGNAAAPQAPSFPKWPLIIFGSLGLGLALGLCLSLIVELLGRRVRGSEDLRIPDVPVIGAMAPARPARANGIFRRLLGLRRPAMQGI